MVMGRSELLQVRLSPEMAEALRSHCATHQVSASDLVRELLLRKLQRPELRQSAPRRGRPRKQE